MRSPYASPEDRKLRTHTIAPTCSPRDAYSSDRRGEIRIESAPEPRAQREVKGSARFAARKRQANRSNCVVSTSAQYGNDPWVKSR